MNSGTVKIRARPATIGILIGKVVGATNNSRQYGYYSRQSIILIYQSNSRPS